MVGALGVGGGGASSTGPGLDFHDSRKLRLPFVSVFDQLLLVVKELLVEEGRVFEVGAFDNGVDGASLCAEAAEDALGHVNVVLGGAAGAIGSGLGLNGDREGGAGRLAQFASDAAFLTSGVAAQGVLASEHRAQGSLLPWIMQDVLKAKAKELVKVLHHRSSGQGAPPLP